MDISLSTRAVKLGLCDPKYAFLFGPKGFPITQADISQFNAIARTAAAFIKAAHQWYLPNAHKSGFHWTGILQHGIPSSYRSLTHFQGLPHTLMIDTVWTAEGWRVVEIDATNRNGLGFPLMMRNLYDLPPIWKGNAASWKEGGFEGAVQIMSNRCRFYEPYYRAFLREIGGKMIAEHEVMQRREEIAEAPCLLDVPILHDKDALENLLPSLKKRRIGIPPVHHLSSKALLSLPWETITFKSHPIENYLPVTYLLRPSRVPTNGKQFFVKLFQAGGAKGTFHNDHEKAKEYASKKPQAVLQDALPLMRRSVDFLEGDSLRTVKQFIRFSLYVDQSGEIVDADVTAAETEIVHGGTRSIMTVPVLTSV